MEDINNPVPPQSPTGIKDQNQQPVGIDESPQPINPPADISPVPTQNTVPTEGWKSALTIIFLVISPLIGIILTWALTNWSKATKIILTVIFTILPIIAITGILAATTLLNLGNAREKARDTQAKTNLRYVASALEAYHEQGPVSYSSYQLPSAYPIGNSFQSVQTELIKASDLPSPIRDRENSHYIYKYCSTDGTKFKLIVNLQFSPQPYEINSPMGIDTCTPGQ